ncbi:hypothetical protein L1987_64442 [Smallanthus sonchifolius]|uniref:Uncharacterized protein n=1 Tax=Smallanthus sonchifolius TaxID=185202 RepID=A0ACB9CG21_9ASTR|nr:hypothetical protein L1987_64442 [Smallanthus sonchifolius]
MVSTRFSLFGYAIIFLSLHFVAYSLQDIETAVMSRNKFDEERAMSRPGKETLNVVHASSGVAVNGGIIGGRKMAKMVNKEHMNGEETASKKASSFSSENPSNRDHKLHKRSKKIDHGDHQVEVKVSSTFMVMNADYHVPRSHPPRHN